MTDENNSLAKIQSATKLVAYFSHEQCNVCKVLKPKVIDLVSEFDDVQFEYIDVEENPEAGGQNMVFAVPTIIFFIEGKEVKRWSRNLAIHELDDVLERYK